MTTIEGKVEAISQKEKGYGIKIGENWYNGFGRFKYNKEDHVRITWEPSPNGNFKDIKQIDQIAPPVATPEQVKAITTRDLQIIRQSSPKLAFEIFELELKFNADAPKDFDDITGEILKRSKRLEHYAMTGEILKPNFEVKEEIVENK